MASCFESQMYLDCTRNITNIKRKNKIKLHSIVHSLLDNKMKGKTMPLTRSSEQNHSKSCNNTLKLGV